MNKKKIKIEYDKGSRVLSVEMGKVKSVDSDIQGNVVIDYDKNGDVARINLYDFSFADFRDNQKALKSFSKNSEVQLVAK
ncbi:hypothetical protein A3I27_04380 [Candidatus Giovannonibacteria bacterium RIFCSPLOWO2_02_FULL_43_11b]|uniref:DUF2283 domain-containing protein n=1 Tax=Candidatus Giovannonibacteria bacterium RIFCSPHIGHO2_12_FULL_43_15 TaxID=1798341 RepID=A0A1F5WQG6_9BACT|nr:MAG: hypothetical protein A2739_00740 [Candidatus Giovannonibacteria bacterium RIFCSPHIGHO2_01_FULL_43_100]OGF66725.1 MAG: hypothetical protein A3B97_02320 [Candidatus Giovannonibacteria bacterium RIFCSPHIGHO2_02_FULL_43_32]OGF77501.1 MAG: hypothetical protein A3F23_00815 [Candidatus Giovannonibacteria bacterium RIFCSPHIGHO2_12_FULL_43_15]OGF78872.1 MAG: hypothetical protein A3A15_00215 [Candidatus Giovannonibacteria bacterium RIFCSPLOWO2_01_FULL_43_60]OGF89945.1 MAG: hypothetical protein A3